MGNAVAKQVLPVSSILIDRIKHTTYAEPKKQKTTKIAPLVTVTKQLR